MAFEKALRGIIASVLIEVLPDLIQKALNKEPSELKPKKEKKQKVQIDTPDVSEPQVDINYEQYRADLVTTAKDVLAAGFRSEVYALLAKYGATKFPELKDEQLQDFRAELESIK